MIVGAVIARLEAIPQTFALVEGVERLSALATEVPTATPAACVFLDEEAAEENERVNGVSQRVEGDLKVVVTTSDVSDARGATGADDMEALKAEVRESLIGWTPPGADDVVTYLGARLVRAAGGYVTVEMTFATAFTVRA
ncbi:phage tail terminator protein [Hansschlegelia zhihuaiae]|uniref:DUF3168 domain-containing protein n=1 Tax=Hansschlegelia zhihuaiae TaxID=405005 RepID=A0A4Q0MPJ8_9HYPH|nr:hypothetical protein [Hansschlegelia zhihuaiae]RXF75079.1 hypothetical protein EK403_03250 [Hansschlegelia zhihuaiae]